uniref:Uncharacterized protein n=1 Tax=Arundo donax TaxID=35708 RepID=A0A0A9H6A0_ARUDO
MLMRGYNNISIVICLSLSKRNMLRMALTGQRLSLRTIKTV